EALDVLVAGCGTGRHALDAAQGYRGARVLAVDISLSSLAAAKRHTPPHLADKIEFAQADILALGGLDRRFDLINSTGVLHHMERALDGWRELIKLLKPDVLMQIGRYSTYARRDVVAVREELIREGAPHEFMRLNDFFTVSECRDLLFHVHERRFTIPEIKAFVDGNGLNFVGFEFSPQAHHHHHAVFARNGWDAYERAEPQIFAGMYIFWVQKK